MARKSMFSSKWRDKIIDLVLQGHSIAAIGKMNGFPTARTLFAWLAANPEFKEAIEIAREVAAEAIYDDAIDIADKCTADTGEVSKAALRVKARLAKANRQATRKPSVSITNNNTATAAAQAEATAIVAGAQMTYLDKPIIEWGEEDIKQAWFNRCLMIMEDDLLEPDELYDATQNHRLVRDGSGLYIERHREPPASLSFADKAEAQIGYRKPYAKDQF